MLPKKNKKEKDQLLLKNQTKKNITSLQDFTPDYLRSFPGLETLSDEEALEAIDSLSAFAQLNFSQFSSLYGHP